VPRFLHEHAFRRFGGWLLFPTVPFGNPIAIRTPARKTRITIRRLYAPAPWSASNPPPIPPNRSFDVLVPCFRLRRSPLLGTLSGVAQTLGFSQLIVRVTLFPVEVQRALKGQWHHIVLLPLVVTCPILVYSIRGLRLIVMYNPDMRKRWGWVLNEPAMVKCVLLAYFAIEVIAWSASLAYGVEKWVAWPTRSRSNCSWSNRATLIARYLCAEVRHL